MKTFGDRLRELREAAGLSQSALAASSGMHRFGVAKLERGERQPSFATVQAIAKALGVSVGVFDDTAPERAEEPPKPSAKRGRPKKKESDR